MVEITNAYEHPSPPQKKKKKKKVGGRRDIESSRIKDTEENFLKEEK